MTRDSGPAIAPFRARLKDKLPEILIEAASVLLALLLAFGAKAWHEHHARVVLAAQARDAIIAELKSNREQLDESLAELDKSMHSVKKQMTSLDDIKGVKIGFPYQAWLPSSVAWRSAQATGAIRDFDYDWTLKVSRVYQRQKLFVHAQQQFLTPHTPAMVPGMAKEGSPARKVFYELLRGQLMASMQMLKQTGSILQSSYATVLGHHRQPATPSSVGGESVHPSD